jgi:hypothetical protein
LTKALQSKKKKRNTSKFIKIISFVIVSIQNTYLSNNFIQMHLYFIVYIYFQAIIKLLSISIGCEHLVDLMAILKGIPN